MSDVDSSIAFGRFRMDLTRRVLMVGAQPVALHARAFDILEYLVEHRDGPVTRDDIIGHVWRGMTVGENNLSVQMSTLRRVLAQHGGADLIVTVPHRGYQFIESAPAAATVTRSPPPAAPELHPDEDDAKALEDKTRGRPVRRWSAAGVAGLITLLIATIVVWKERSPAGAPQATTTAQAFNPPPHSVAVLAFANLSGDPAQEYFSDGLSEELIDLLTRVQQLHVVGRTSSFSFKGKPVTIREIARTLNVGAVLEGSVRRQGSRLRITAALNDAKTGYQLWARDFDRDQGDLLHMQTEIASAVTGALQVTLLGGETAQLALGGTNDPLAFDEYLKGVRALRENMIDSYHAAIAHFDNAIKSDPGFALAHSGRADAVSYLAMVAPNLGAADIRRMFADALASADRGVALAPGLGLTHAARGFVLSDGLLDHEQGFEELTRARAATPGNATIEMIYTNVAISVGHIQEGVSAAYRAVELDPLRQDSWGCLGFVLFQARQYAASVDALQHARSVASNFPPQFVSQLGMSLLMQGKSVAARDTCAASAEWEASECLALVHYALGKKEEAHAELSKMRAALGDTGAYNYAEIYAQWGQPADALAWLKRAAELRDPGLADLTTDPLIDPIRNQPGFRDIEQNAHLTPSD